MTRLSSTDFAMTNPDSEILTGSTDIARDIARDMIGRSTISDQLSDHQTACRRIGEHSFCPPGELHQAIVTLSAPLSLIDDPVFAEQISVTRLEEFCRRFFSIPPQRRSELWNELDRQFARMPQLQWRLRTLKDGLDIESSPANLSPPAAELAQKICEILVMPPAESIQALRRLCIAAAKKDKGWEIGDSFEELYRTLPVLTSLRPAIELPPTLQRIRGDLERQSYAKYLVDETAVRKLHIPDRIRRFISVIGAVAIISLWMLTNARSYLEWPSFLTTLWDFLTYETPAEDAHTKTPDVSQRHSTSEPPAAKREQSILIRRNEIPRDGTSLSSGSFDPDSFSIDDYEEFIIQPDGRLISKETGLPRTKATNRTSSQSTESDTPSESINE